MTNPTIFESLSSQKPTQAQAQVPYILFYRQGSNPHPLFFVFYFFSNDMRIVVDRIKKHCELMNYRFVHVRPFIVDIDAVETKAFGTTAALGVSE